MIANLYSVIDRLAGEGSPLFEAKNDACAHRIFTRDLMGIKVDPSDYYLVRVGSVDHETSLITPLPAPVAVMVGSGEVEDV